MNRPSIRTILGVVLIGSCTLQTHRDVAVWRSDLALWTHAVSVAPLKPRPQLNYGLALLRSGRWAEAEIAFLRAQALAQQPHVPSWDRTDVATAVLNDLAIVRFLQATAHR